MKEYRPIKKTADHCAAHLCKKPGEFIEYFEANCKKFPDIPALRSETDKKGITYGQLDQYSASVYACLKKKGIGREQMVFVYLPRDTGMVVAVLGIIKAGAAFVLCEDTYPEDRVAFIKKDCECVLTIDKMVLDEMLTETPLYGHEKTEPHDACFAVYTSGSTGTPKGVLHEYGKLMQITESVARISPELPVGANHALSAPFNFVAAILAMLRALYDGLCLCVLPYNIAKDATKLSMFIKNEDVKEAFLSLSILKLCKDDLYEGLTHVFAGGEAYPDICLPKNVCFDGTYCSSESAFVVASFRIEKAYDKPPAGKNAIGVEILILDDHGNRLPDGEIGEICFKNEFTRGYIHLPEKTAEAFVDEVYHTGDLGFIDENENLFVCGRKDDMIKIDGNRIEPAEIEAAVKKEFGLSHVIAKGFHDEKRSFICVYLLEDEIREKNFSGEDGNLIIDKNEFLERLSKKLPYYMLPTYYSVLSSFPVNANGKLDKKKLEAPKTDRFHKEYTAPSNETEEKLCNTMADVLGIERVGVDDDFYEIGGDSVNAIRVISRMNLPLLDVNTLFAGRTVKKIAKLYEEATKEGVKSLDERNALELTKEHPISAQQQYILDYESRYPGTTMWNISMLLKFESDTDMERLKKAIDTALKVHPVFSVVFAYDANNQLVQKYDANKIFDTKIEEISEADFAVECKNLVRPFELLHHPLFRVRLFRTECSGYFFMDFHHSIVDGTSIQVLKNDICLAYDGKMPEPDYYFVFLEDKKKNRNSPLYEEGVAYYKDTIKKYRWDSRLKADFDSQKNTYGNMTAMIPLGPADYEKIHKLYGLGENAFFIAVTAVALSLYNASGNIRIAWIYNGRETVSSQHAVGELLNCFYVGFRFDELKTLGALLKETAIQVKNNVKYACCRYPGIEEMIESHGDISLIYQSHLRSLEAAGTLHFTAVELPGLADSADNLLDVEIHETAEGCKLYMDYNASVYKRESIERFGGMLTEAACVFAQNADNPDLRMSDIMERIRIKTGCAAAQ